jgi:putative membrane protein
MWWFNGDWGWGWIGFLVMIFFMVIFWGAIIFLVVWAVRQLSGRSGGSRAGSSHAIDIARERYARGEINKEDFDRIKRDLS